MFKQWSKRVLVAWIDVFCTLAPSSSEIEEIVGKLAETGQPVPVREAAAYLTGMAAEKLAH